MLRQIQPPVWFAPILPCSCFVEVPIGSGGPFSCEQSGVLGQPCDTDGLGLCRPGTLQCVD